MALNPITALSEQLQKLINEHGSAAILRDHLALFKDKVLLLEKKYAELEIENTGLKEKLVKSQNQNEELRIKLQNYEQTPSSDTLEEVKVNILKFMANYDETYAGSIASAIKIGLQTAQFHLEDLQDQGFVDASYCIGSETTWYLAQGGRKYLVRNNLIT